MKKTQHKIPQTLMATRIQQAVTEQLKNQIISPDQHNALRGELQKKTDQVTQLQDHLADKGQQLLDQAKRHQISVDELKTALQNSSAQIVPVMESFSEHSGLFVKNWRSSWKWFSNWCFGLIVFFAVTPIPPEVLAALPANVRAYVIAFMASCGIALRYINQSKVKALPPITGADNV